MGLNRQSFAYQVQRSVVGLTFTFVDDGNLNPLIGATPHLALPVAPQQMRLVLEQDSQTSGVNLLPVACQPPLAVGFLAATARAADVGRATGIGKTSLS